MAGLKSGQMVTLFTLRSRCVGGRVELPVLSVPRIGGPRCASRSQWTDLYCLLGAGRKSFPYSCADI